MHGCGLPDFWLFAMPRVCAGNLAASMRARFIMRESNIPANLSGRCSPAARRGSKSSETAGLLDLPKLASGPVS